MDQGNISLKYLKSVKVDTLREVNLLSYSLYALLYACMQIFDHITTKLEGSVWILGDLEGQGISYFSYPSLESLV